MISSAEYCIIINVLEIGPCVQEILDIQKQAGHFKHVNDETFKIMCPSPIYQRRLFEQLEQAMDEDFPPECEDCGCPQDECCCEDGDDEPRA